MTAKPFVFGKKFKKNYQKRILGNQKLMCQFKERLDLFKSDRNNSLLKDHPLKGLLKNYRAFSITSDIRIIYQEEENYFLLFDIGTHVQVYDM